MTRPCTNFREGVSDECQSCAQRFAQEQRGVEFIFGNPGSTELPFLAGVPVSVEHVTALQKASVGAMARANLVPQRAVSRTGLHATTGSRC